MSNAVSSSRPAKPVRRARKPSRLPRRTQADRREAAEQRLLDAAIKLIAERGIKGATLGDVGEAAGYSRGLTAHHYKTKEGLIKAVAAEIHRRFYRAVTSAEPASDGLARLLRAVDVYLSVNDVPAARALLLIQKEALMQQSEFRGVLRKFNRLAVDGIALQIRAGIAKGEIRPDIDALAEATLLLAALRGARAQWLLSSKDFDVGRVGDQLKAHLQRSLAPA
ncbi:MAG: TetR/AcrR family transcriptional regulator [Reyranella sp.]|nr:TetR/AcrR family transcriptional regulator [Reyranella sp.]